MPPYRWLRVPSFETCLLCSYVSGTRSTVWPEKGACARSVLFVGSSCLRNSPLLIFRSEFKGFKITAVNGIITRTKTNNNQTLLDYFVRHVHHSMPELLTLMDDFTAVAGAARKPLSYHKAEITRTKRDVATLQNAWDTGDEAYARCLADFVPHIAQRVELLHSKSQELESSYEELCRYQHAATVVHPLQ